MLCEQSSNDTMGLPLPLLPCTVPHARPLQVCSGRRMSSGRSPIVHEHHWMQPNNFDCCRHILMLEPICCIVKLGLYFAVSHLGLLKVEYKCFK